MCGIVGALALGGDPLRAAPLHEMTCRLAHRGPDDAGFLVYGSARDGGGPEALLLTERDFADLHPDLQLLDAGPGREAVAGGRWEVFLGHRRLSILDLSPRGHQPMAAPDGTAWISYNGEVYNFRELRTDLEAAGRDFRTGTDTEVVLAAYQAWGDAFVERLDGMFALAIWDARRDALVIARDRYGIKPLYLAESQGALLFASEIKALLPYLPDRPRVDLLGLNEYFSFQNILSNRTLFGGVRVLPPGHLLVAPRGQPPPAPQRYWDFAFQPAPPRPEGEVEEELFSLIEAAVQRQCVADVAIGSYLSGGLDSGTVASITARTRGRINTFTAGFDMSEAAPHELPFDERRQAERMAHFLDTDHYQVVLGPDHMERVMDRLVHHLEDLRVGQCYPNFYAAQLASRFNRVVMSGMGGDELFGGYPWRYAAAVGADRDDYIANYYAYWQRLVPDEAKAALYRPDVGAAIRDRAGGSFRDHTLGVFRSVFPGELCPSSVEDQVDYSLYFEAKTFLHGLLIVEDRISMAHSLETRVPLLDNALVDFACRIPVGMKVEDLDHLQVLDENLARKKRRISTGKKVLRQAMTRFLPPEVTSGRKQGFSAPDESWFSGAAHGWVRDLLTQPGSHIGEFLEPEFVASTLDEHVAGKQNKRLLLWSLLSFETLLRTYF